MNNLLEYVGWSGGELGQRIALVLLHFLWQGCVIGGIALVLTKLTRGAGASFHYRTLCMAFACLPVCAITTFFAAQTDPMLHAASEIVSSEFMENSNTKQSLNAVQGPHESSPFSADDDVTAPRDGIDQPRSSTTPKAAGNLMPASLFKSSFTAASWPFVVVAYLAGVLIGMLRLVVVWIGSARVRSAARPINEGAQLAVVLDCAKRLGLSRIPMLACSDKSKVPVILGVFQPVIIVPSSIISGLSPDQFTAIITHELVHLRRWDLLINFLQRLTETILFFHPVVWWLSRRIDFYREVSCDEIAVDAGHEPLEYAGALIRCAELCSATLNRPLSLAATGSGTGHLEHRIQRLLSRTPSQRLGGMVPASMVGAMLLTSTMVLIPRSDQAAALEPPETPESRVTSSQPNKATEPEKMDTKRLLETLQGTWELVSLRMGDVGSAFPQMAHRMTINGDRIRIEMKYGPEKANTMNSTAQLKLNLPGANNKSPIPPGAVTFSMVHDRKLVVDGKDQKTSNPEAQSEVGILQIKDRYLRTASLKLPIIHTREKEANIRFVGEQTPRSFQTGDGSMVTQRVFQKVDDAFANSALVRIAIKGDAQPLEDLQVSLFRDQERQVFLTGWTDQAGVIAARLPSGRYTAQLTSDNPLPYLQLPHGFQGHPSHSRMSMTVVAPEDAPEGAFDASEDMLYLWPTNVQSFDYRLARGCQLLLRAIDIETGKGVPGVVFATENASDEQWAQPINGDNLGAPVVNKLKDPSLATDAEGYFRRRMGPRPGWVYFIWDLPEGYIRVDPGLEATIETDLKRKSIQHSFFVRKRAPTAKRDTSGAIRFLDPQKQRNDIKDSDIRKRIEQYELAFNLQALVPEYEATRDEAKSLEEKQAALQRILTKAKIHNYDWVFKQVLRFDDHSQMAAPQLVLQAEAYFDQRKGRSLFPDWQVRMALAFGGRYDSAGVRTALRRAGGDDFNDEDVVKVLQWIHMNLVHDAQFWNHVRNASPFYSDEDMLPARWDNTFQRVHDALVPYFDHAVAAKPRDWDLNHYKRLIIKWYGTADQRSEP